MLIHNTFTISIGIYQYKKRHVFFRQKDITDDNIAQFIITSKSVPENSGDAKGGYFDEEDEEETNPNPWDEPLF